MIVIERVRWSVREPLSVTRNVKLDVPEPVGVPPIAPLEAFKDKPSGNVPTETSHEYGVVPPVAIAVVEYA